MTDRISILIWERKFDLPVEYDRYSDEKITKEQEEALAEFIRHPDWIYNSKASIEEYCKVQVMEDERNEKKDNIFSYVKPDYVYVKRNRRNEKEKPKVALMCKYKYDPEHGLAVVFSEGSVTVGIQDIIL